MFKLTGKEINANLGAQTILIRTYDDKTSIMMARARLGLCMVATKIYLHYI